MVKKGAKEVAQCAKALGVRWCEGIVRKRIDEGRASHANGVHRQALPAIVLLCASGGGFPDRHVHVPCGPGPSCPMLHALMVTGFSFVWPAIQGRIV
jgi:hypothetical protein